MLLSPAQQLLLLLPPLLLPLLLLVPAPPGTAAGLIGRPAGSGVGDAAGGLTNSRKYAVRLAGLGEVQWQT